MTNLLTENMITRKFQDLSLMVKFSVLLAIPLIGLAGFSGIVINRSLDNVSENRVLESLSNLAVKISNMVYEQQKERGMTAGFLGSKGQLFSSQIGAQRNMTDQRRRALFSYLEQEDTSAYGKNFNDKLAQMRSSLDRMASIRAEVDSQSISVKKAVTYYTDLNEQGLSIIAYMTSISKNPTLSNYVYAYVNFLRSKEEAGIERAIGTGAFSAGKFRPVVLDKFKSLITIQKAAIETFKVYATDQQKYFYNSTMNNRAVSEVERMRKLAINYPRTKSLGGVSGTAWFNAITNKIDSLKKVEDRLSGDLTAYADHIMKQSIASRNLYITLSLIVVTLALFFAYVITKGIVGPILLTKEALNKLTEGDSSCELPDVHSRDEVGAMVASLAKLKHSVARNIRLQCALESVSSGVMMADADNIITYMNPSSVEIFRHAQEDIRKGIPAFDAEKIIGSHIDTFHTSSKIAAVDGLSGKHDASFAVGARDFKFTANPVVAADGSRLGTVVEWQDVTEELARERERVRMETENLRIKSATDGASTNIMVADVDYNIVYMNKTMQQMLERNESQLKTELPRLNCDKLIGANIDIFHKDPSHQRKILDNQTDTVEANIAVAGLDFVLAATPIFDENGTRAGTTVEWEDVTEKLARERKEKRVAGENLRIRIALDNARTNMMVADKEFNIVYMNKALQEMMRSAENELRKALPNFNAGQIIGSNIDIFHKNPAHQRGMLGNITTTINSTIKVGIFDFNLNVNPVVNGDGERLGLVVEWKDMSQELAIEAEIDQVVTATLAGDFTQRITTEGKQGFMLGLAKNINEIGSTTQTATDDMAWIMAELAKGNLTEKIETEYQGTFDLLKNSSNKTVDQLTNIVTQVNQSAAEVASASAELSTGSDDLSRRTEAQASALEETAASMEQLAVTVKQNADNAKDANKLAEKSREMAINGGDVAKEAVDAMGVIEESSQQVSDIIGVIDDLAFQTNLLALNAAVEAARAGEAGKGFAVVAEEVRTLAQRSAQASNEIKSLITSSNAQVKNGVELVNNAGTVLGNIMESIAKVATIVSEIANASSEQTQGIDEVNVAIAEMDDMTQQNSSLVEQSTAAARVLERQAAEMQRLMSFFNVGAGAGQQAALSPVLLQQQQAERSLAAEPVVTPKLKRKVAAGSGMDSDWAEF
ncbi:MAG: PAS domain-containing protein [Alphaproteobacteria bacterium]|nr:PAS domain-containing protein [Alphaproteobacteria bacterium]